MNNANVEVPVTTSSLSSRTIEIPNSEMNTVKTNLYTPFIMELEENKNNNGLAEVDFDNLLMVTDNSDTRELLNKMLVGMYETNTNRLTEINGEIEKLQDELHSSLGELRETERDIRNLKDDLTTNTRKVEIELNETRRTEYQIHHMIVILVCSVVALLFPILKMFGVLNTIVATLLFVVVMTGVAGYSGYFLWYKLLDVDPNDFSKKNLSQNVVLEKTSDEDRECLPTDTEDSFENEVEEPCVNPAELVIPDDKMAEYLNNSCSREDETPRI